MRVAGLLAAIMAAIAGEDDFFDIATAADLPDSRALVPVSKSPGPVKKKAATVASPKSGPNHESGDEAGTAPMPEDLCWLCGCAGATVKFRGHPVEKRCLKAIQCHNRCVDQSHKDAENSC